MVIGEISRTDFQADFLNFQVTENPLNGGSMVMGEEANRPVLDVNLDNTLDNDVVIVVDEGNLINPDAVGVTHITDCNKIPTKSKGRKAAGSWQLAGPKIIGRAHYCPSAVIKYALKGTNPHDPAVVDIRKHISYLGWKIEYIRDKRHIDVLRFRYTSPDGKRYFSLVQLCRDLRESTMEIPPSIPQEESDSQNDIISSSSRDTNVCPQVKGFSSDDILQVKPEHCPEAVVYWYLHGLDKKQNKEDIKASDMTWKVKKHLSFLRWKFWYVEKGKKCELRYTSPSGATYYSLRTACKACIDGGQIPEWLALSEKLSSSTENAKQSSSIPQSKKRKRENNLLDSEYGRIKKPKIGTVKKLGDDPKGNQPTRVLRLRKSARQEVLPSQPTAALQSSKRVRQEVLPSLPYRNPQTVLSWLIDNNAVLPEDKVHYRGRNGGLPLATGRITRDGIKCNCCDKLFTLTGFEAHAGSTNHRPAANIILEGGRSLFDCQIQVGHDGKPRSNTRNKPQGMNGNCHPDDNDRIDGGQIPERSSSTAKAKLQERFVPSKKRQSSSIPQSKKRKRKGNLSDDDDDDDEYAPKTGQFRRTLKKLEGKSDGKTRSSTRKKCQPQRMNGNCHQDENDNLCSVCQCGGDLILCDQCPSSFHKSCLGLKDVPDGDWCCPSCCCGICSQSKVTEASEHSADNSVLTCEQCEQKYHAGCLRSRGVVKLESLLQGKWFCSSECEKVYSGLHELLGRPIPVSLNNLTWTLVKATESDIDSKSYSKLNVALKVMHECFDPCKEAYTGRDLVQDVIFSRRSELKRLNFKGFYTVLLENKEEVISVANVRVYGNKVAEVPLVATRFKFRGLGMCRMLMNELEKKLKELGVERLVLPAVPSVLNTWTTSFGFSKTTDSERVQFLNYTFLDFQGTIMCQKLLVKSPSPDSSQGNSPADHVHGSCNEIEFDWSNHKSEVLQEGHIEEGGVVNQCLMQPSVLKAVAVG